MTSTIHQYFEWPYQARITIPSPNASATYQSWVDISWIGGMQSDFSDLRFFNKRGEKLPYWNESKTDGVTGRFWIRGATDREVFILFGNPDAESESDGGSVFPTFFDDFEDGVLDTDKWTRWLTGGSSTESGGKVRVLGGANWEGLGSKIQWTYPYVVRLCIQYDAEGAYHNVGADERSDGGGGDDWAEFQNEGAKYYRSVENNNAKKTARTSDFSSPTIVEIRQANASAVYFYEGDILKATHSTTRVPDCNLGISLLAKGSGKYVDCFWALKREYAATEPVLTFQKNVEPNPYYYLAAFPDPEILLLATGSYVTGVPKTIQGKYSLLLEKALTGQYDILLFVPVEKSLQGKYSIFLEESVTGQYSLSVERSLQGKYSLLMEPSITGTYDIFHRRTLEVPYDILVQKTLQLLYDIDVGIYLDYVVLVEDAAFTEIFDLAVSGKVSQTSIASFSLVPTSEEESYLDPGKEIHILFNDSTIFSGEIKKAVKDDVSGIWTVECGGLASQVQDLKVETAAEYRSVTRENLVEPLLPAGWELEIDDGDRFTSYVLEHKDHLEHIVQLSKDFGLEWLAVQEEELRRVVSVTANTITLDTAVTASRYTGYYLYILSGTAKYTGALVTGNTTTVVTTSGVDWTASGVQAGDLVLLYGPKQLQMVDQVGSLTSVVTLKIGTGIYDCKRTRDLDKVKNRLIVPGQTSGLQKTVAVCDAAVVTPAALAFSEPYLAANLSDTETVSMEILGASPLAFVNVGVAGKVRIDDEIIAYTNAWEDYPPGESPGAIVGLTRGVDGTTPAAHNIYASVLVHGYLPVTGDGAADLPSSGAVWIGGEKIAYTQKITEPALGTYIKGLTRGVSGSPAYGHRAGTWVRDAAYSPSSPETGSSIQLYGLREDLVPADALDDRADLDIQAQNYLAVAKDLHTFGTAMLGMADFTVPVSLGDVITIEEMESSTQTAYRVFGLEFDQMSGSITIRFGTVQEELLETLRDIKTAKNLATSRRPPGRFGTIAEISGNEEMIQATMDDGSTVWARMQ